MERRSQMKEFATDGQGADPCQARTCEMRRPGQFLEVACLEAGTGLDCDCLCDEEERNDHCELVRDCESVCVLVVWRATNRADGRSCLPTLGIAVEMVASVLILAAAKLMPFGGQ